VGLGELVVVLDDELLDTAGDCVLACPDIGLKWF